MNISVAMCTYNGEKYLGEQLRSLAEQTKAPGELIVCDDGSTDGTRRLVEEFAVNAGFPVRFVCNATNLGSTRNFEQAIRLCRGEVIALCDQDDQWAPDKLARMVKVLQSDPAIGGVFSDAALMDDASQVLPLSLWEHRNFTVRRQAALRRNAAAQLLQYNPATGATLIFRSQFVADVTPIPEEWVHDAWIALIIATRSRLALVPEKLIHYRIHRGQQIGVKRMRPSDDLLVAKWSALQAKLAVLPVDPNIRRMATSKLQFFIKRRALKQRRLPARAWAASGALPGYFHFARGLFSYALDIAGMRS